MPYGDLATTRREAKAESAAESDPRSPFAHDRDRVLYCSAFRRLAGKTQVVAAEELGLYHTRLTHSLKVAQLGRRIAERLQLEFTTRNPTVRPTNGLVPPDPDLVEAACLAHDLGHPPFGHIGEYTLGAVLDDQDRLGKLEGEERSTALAWGGFEGNAQTFRILTFLAARRPFEPRVGLNLTRATLDACIKYPRGRLDGGVEHEKWNVYGCDMEAFDWVRPDSAMRGSDAGMCFEAQLMNWCDDVTFAVHDVVDFYRGGFIPLDRLFLLDPKSESLPEEAEAVLERFSQKNGDFDMEQSRAAWRALSPQIEVFEPWNSTVRVKSATQTTTSQLITYLVGGIRYDGDAPARFDGQLIVDSSEEKATLVASGCSLLKSLIFEYVIETPSFAAQQFGQAEIVRRLVETYSAARDTGSKIPEILPPDRQEEIEIHGDRRRAAVDHVASLTEQDAHMLFERLFGLRLGAITDAI